MFKAAGEAKLENSHIKAAVYVWVYPIFSTWLY